MVGQCFFKWRWQEALNALFQVLICWKQMEDCGSSKDLNRNQKIITELYRYYSTLTRTQVNALYNQCSLLPEHKVKVRNSLSISLCPKTRNYKILPDGFQNHPQTFLWRKFTSLNCRLSLLTEFTEALSVISE